MAQSHRRHLLIGVLLLAALALAMSGEAQSREEFTLDYVLYYLEGDGGFVDVVVALHTYDCLEEAKEAVAEATDLEPREVSEGIIDLNATLGVAVHSSKKTGGGWVPNAQGSVWLFLVEEHLPLELDYAVSNRDGSQLKWKMLLDNEGIGHTIVTMPDSRGVYWLVPDVTSRYYPDEYRRMEDEVVHLDISEVDREIGLEYVFDLVVVVPDPVLEPGARSSHWRLVDRWWEGGGGSTAAPPEACRLILEGPPGSRAAIRARHPTGWRSIPGVVSAA